MRRRDFIILLTGTTVMRPIAAWAQQREQIARIGVLMSAASEDPEGQARIAAFRQGLQKLGRTEGQNMRIDVRWSGGNADLDRKFAVELVALKPDVILATASPTVRPHLNSPQRETVDYGRSIIIDVLDAGVFTDDDALILILQHLCCATVMAITVIAL